MLRSLLYKALLVENQRHQSASRGGDLTGVLCCDQAGLFGTSNLHIAPLDLGSSLGNGVSMGPVSSSVDSEATFSDALLGSSAPSPSTVLPIHHPQQVPLLQNGGTLRRFDSGSCVVRVLLFPVEGYPRPAGWFSLIGELLLEGFAGNSEGDCLAGRACPESRSPPALLQRTPIHFGPYDFTVVLQ